MCALDVVTSPGPCDKSYSDGKWKDESLGCVACSSYIIVMGLGGGDEL